MFCGTFLAGTVYSHIFPAISHWIFPSYFYCKTIFHSLFPQPGKSARPNRENRRAPAFRIFGAKCTLGEEEHDVITPHERIASHRMANVFKNFSTLLSNELPKKYDPISQILQNSLQMNSQHTGTVKSPPTLCNMARKMSGCEARDFSRDVMHPTSHRRDDLTKPRKGPRPEFQTFIIPFIPHGASANDRCSGTRLTFECFSAQG